MMRLRCWHRPAAPPPAPASSAAARRSLSQSARPTCVLGRSQHPASLPQGQSLDRPRSFGAGPDALQALLEEPAVAEALSLRRQILAANWDLLDSWEFDVWFFTGEQLIAHLCLMFMHAGLTQTQVRCGCGRHSPGRRLAAGRALRSSLVEHPAREQRCAPVQRSMPCAVCHGARLPPA